MKNSISVNIQDNFRKELLWGDFHESKIGFAKNYFKMNIKNGEERISLVKNYLAKKSKEKDRGRVSLK